jgi:hypothetical protein
MCSDELSDDEQLTYQRSSRIPTRLRCRRGPSRYVSCSRNRSTPGALGFLTLTQVLLRPDTYRLSRRFETQMPEDAGMGPCSCTIGRLEVLMQGNSGVARGSQQFCAHRAAIDADPRHSARADRTPTASSTYCVYRNSKSAMPLSSETTASPSIKNVPLILFAASNARIAIRPVITAVREQTHARSPDFRTISRQPSCLISCTHTGLLAPSRLRSEMQGSKNPGRNRALTRLLHSI